MIYVIIVLLGIFQLTLMPYLTIGSARIDILIILSVYIIVFTPLKVSRRMGLILSLFCGVMKGIVSMDRFNEHVILFTAMGLGLIWLKDKIYRENAFCQMAVIFFAAGFIFFGEYLSTAMKIHLGAIVYSALYTAIVSPLFFKMLTVISKIRLQ